MATERHLAAVAHPPTASAEPASPSGVPTFEALASFLRHVASRRGRSGRITSPETVRSYTSTLPTAFAGITDLGGLAKGVTSCPGPDPHPHAATGRPSAAGSTSRR
jgi:hypothetical protein